MDWKFVIYFNSLEYKLDLKKIAIIYHFNFMLYNKIDCVAGKTFFEVKEYRNHFVLIPFYRLKWIAWPV